MDPRGAAIDPNAGMYRLRMRQNAPGGAGEDTGPWLTDWLPAQGLGTVQDGMRFEVVLLRSQIPALATVRGDIEIELRGANEFGVDPVPARDCWEHVPLAPPLQVRNVVESFGAGSLHEANLDPGNNLAPLLEGVPLEQGRAVMDLEIVNGTDEVVYAQLAIEQVPATFTRSWQKTNAALFIEPASDCLTTGECTLSYPSDHQTVVATAQAGTINGLVDGILVQDTITGQRISPCEGCNSDTYRIEPRITLGDPRVYRVRLVVTDLRVLAPQLPGVNLGPFSDVPLDAEMLRTSITGRTFGRWRLCVATTEPQSCIEDRVYQHYVALTEASLSLPGVRILARTSPSPELPAIMLPAQPGCSVPPSVSIPISGARPRSHCR